MQRVEEERKVMMKEIRLARGRLRLGDEETVVGLGVRAGRRAEGARLRMWCQNHLLGRLLPQHRHPLNRRQNQDSIRTCSSSFRSPFTVSAETELSFLPVLFRFTSLLRKIYTHHLSPLSPTFFYSPSPVAFSVCKEAVNIKQPNSIAKYGIGESVGRSGEVLEDNYGIAVCAESFVNIVTGVNSSRFAGRSSRIGEEVTRRGLGLGADGRPVVGDAGGTGRGTGELVSEKKD